MTVRRFKDRDVESVVQAAPERDASIHDGRLAEQSDGSCVYLLASSEDGIVGWVVVRTAAASDAEWRVRFECAEIEDLFVVPAARRRGYGRELMNAAEEAARANGFQSIGLATAVEDDADSDRLARSTRAWATGSILDRQRLDQSSLRVYKDEALRCLLRPAAERREQAH
jgi:GNAT superfamily N-acetyltransferase